MTLLLDPRKSRESLEASMVISDGETEVDSLEDSRLCMYKTPPPHFDICSAELLMSSEDEMTDVEEEEEYSTPNSTPNASRRNSLHSESEESPTNSPSTGVSEGQQSQHWEAPEGAEMSSCDDPPCPSIVAVDLPEVTKLSSPSLTRILAPPAQSLHLSSEVSMREHLAAMHVSSARRFPPHPLSLEDQIDQLNEMNRELQAHLRKALDGNLQTADLITENVVLKQKLDEINNYIDQIDNEAEQEFGSLSEEIEHLSSLVEEKSNDVAEMEGHVRTIDEENKALKEKLENATTKYEKQKEWVEELREELRKRQTTDRDEELAALKNELETVRAQMTRDREEFKKKELLFQCDLEDFQRELNVQKEILSASSVGDIVKAWDERVSKLENELRERESIIFTQQHLLNEMRRRQSMASPSPALPRRDTIQQTSNNSVNSRSH